MTNNMNKNTPLSEVWNTIRIKGKLQRKIAILEDGNEIYSTIPEIVNKLAYTFSRVSATSSYSGEFQAMTVNKEKVTLVFRTESNESTNQSLRRTELEDAGKLKLTDPGTDGITNEIRNLPEKAMMYIFNRHYKEGYFPKKMENDICYSYT